MPQSRIDHGRSDIDPARGIAFAVAAGVTAWLGLWIIAWPWL